MLKFLDWFYSEDMGGTPGEPFTGRLLPEWPQWLCGLLTKHKQTLKWSDRLADIGGIRCRCGLHETEH
jgi:hypothetical protein